MLHSGISCKGNSIVCASPDFGGGKWGLSVNLTPSHEELGCRAMAGWFSAFLWMPAVWVRAQGVWNMQIFVLSKCRLVANRWGLQTWHWAQTGEAVVPLGCVDVPLPTGASACPPTGAPAVCYGQGWWEGKSWFLNLSTTETAASPTNKATCAIVLGAAMLAAASQGR